MQRTWAPGYLMILTQATFTQLPVQASSHGGGGLEGDYTLLNRAEFGLGACSRVTSWLQRLKEQQTPIQGGLTAGQERDSLTSAVISGHKRGLRH